MATERKPEKPVEEAKKKLTINTSSEVLVAPVKDGTLSDAASCVSSGDATSSVKGLSYYPMNYYGYYYPVSFAERDDQSYVVGSDGLEFQQPAFPTDNSSVLYYKPGFQSTFGTYSPFLPGDYISTDGQYLGQQGYYAGSMFPHPVLSPGCFSPSAAYGPDLVPEYTWDTSYIYGDGANGHGVGDSPIPALRGGLSQAHSPTRVPVPSKSGTSPGRAVSPGSAIHGQTPKTGNKVASVVSKGYIPVTKFPPYHNQVKSVVPYTNSGFSVKENGQSWVGSDKLKTRNKLGIDFLNEQNRGPRTSSHKSASESGSDAAGVFSADDCNGQNTISPDIDIKREDYNLEDFPTKYEHALFFVIKSYSEDDIHKSIKYNVWASTPNGNQRLDNAFQISQAKMGEKGSKCPVFLFFSVNASGQFCGVAEMIGRVNFNKNMDFWQQDKWNGFFPVKWHIIKDVPNSQFRHIILENNDNKPVTNSRDTQEVKFSQGMEVLGIFKAFSSKTSILDDFSFYDNRQKAMQSKRSKAHAPHLEGLSVKSSDAAAPVGKAGELDPLIAGLKAVELGPAKSAGEPQMGVEVKE